MPEYYKRTPNTKCSVCEKPIYRRPKQIINAQTGLFCSTNCNGISQRKETPCIVCGKLILAGLHKKTCSRSCANKNRTGVRYKIGRPKDKVKSQQALKLRLLEKRGKACERCCYNKFEILQIHHKDRNKHNNNLNNLEILCPNCHYEDHFLEKSWLKTNKKVE